MGEVRGIAEERLHRFAEPTIFLAPDHSDAKISKLHDVIVWLLVHYVAKGKHRTQFLAGPAGAEPVVEEQIVFHGTLAAGEVPLPSVKELRSRAIRDFRRLSRNWSNGDKDKRWPRGCIIHPVDGTDWIFAATHLPEYAGELIGLIIATQIDDEKGLPGLQDRELKAYRERHESLRAWRKYVMARTGMPWLDAFERHRPWWK